MKDDDIVKQALIYNPVTGMLVWSKTMGKRAICNSQAGSLGKKGYIQIMISGKSYKAHRIAWLLHYGSWPLNEIDHIDGDKSNNSIANLRDVDRFKNNENIRKAKNSSRSTGLLGASFNMVRQKYYSRIAVNHKQIHLGCFDTALEAHECYINAKRLIHEGCTI